MPIEDLPDSAASVGPSQYDSIAVGEIRRALMQLSLAPGWIRTVAKFNPVDWAVVGARDADLLRLGLLGALVVVSAWFATRAFGVYQRSL